MWLLVVNPTSGKHKGSELAQELSVLLKLNNIGFQLIDFPDLLQTKNR